jgi:site-specific DNA-methyltransferase (adenine-specific)
MTEPYYDDGTVTIYHGDCRDVPHAPGLFDVLLTDPPYGMAYQSGADAFTSAIAADGVRQGVRTVREMLFQTQAAMKSEAHFYLFCHWQSWPDFYDAVNTYVRVRNALIWWKRTAGMGNFAVEFSKDYEAILFAVAGQRPFADGSRKGSVLDGFKPVAHAARTHPTEKPVALLAYLLTRSAKRGDVILDPFMGSGATLVAAKQLGLRAVGIELDERYCEAAARRLSQEVLDLAA